MGFQDKGREGIARRRQGGCEECDWAIRFRQHDRDKGLVAIRSRHVGLSRRGLGRRRIEPSRSQDLRQNLPEQGQVLGLRSRTAIVIFIILLEFVMIIRGLFLLIRLHLSLKGIWVNFFLFVILI
ncbi:hypothetical protein Taro_014307 [Colocasia esculenta]|uniref:Uncharacterized protein n=1 Tax=Colocasia esculenta TaxID=4460 RepID=A0A843UIP1_COLES|nr:hypothetical protein [Colocasia esculenta]